MSCHAIRPHIMQRHETPALCRRPAIFAQTKHHISSLTAPVEPRCVIIWKLLKHNFWANVMRHGSFPQTILEPSRCDLEPRGTLTRTPKIFCSQCLVAALATTWTKHTTWRLWLRSGYDKSGLESTNLATPHDKKQLFSATPSKQWELRR